jgi:hypothetical protein
VSKKPVPTGDVDDAAPAQETPDTPRSLPRLEELLARQAPRMAHSAGEAIEECIVREAAEIVVGESSARRKRERHAL